jgi:hypothetical protein
LDKAVVLEHVNCLQRPVMSREVEVAVHVTTVLPVCREAAYTFIDSAFLDPKAGVGPQLQIERIVAAGDFVRTISEGNLDHMQHDVRARFHVKPKIMESFSSALPAVRVGIHRNDVQLLGFGVLHKLAMNVGVLEGQDLLLSIWCRRPVCCVSAPRREQQYLAGLISSPRLGFTGLHQRPERQNCPTSAPDGHATL